MLYSSKFKETVLYKVRRMLFFATSLILVKLVIGYINNFGSDLFLPCSFHRSIFTLLVSHKKLFMSLRGLDGRDHFYIILISKKEKLCTDITINQILKLNYLKFSVFNKSL